MINKQTNKFKSIRRKIKKFFRREIFLKNKNFCIISNNCFGGSVYQYFDLPYNSPTIGLYFFPEDYIKFLKNLKYYLSLELKFIPNIKSKNYNFLTEESRKCPIGVLDDIEVIFLHYKTEKEAFEKWNRRKKRMNWDNLIVKFNDQNNTTLKDIREFDKLPYENKLCFVANPIDGVKSIIEFKEDNGKDYVLNDASVNKCKKYINIIEYLNKIGNKK